MYLRIRYAFSMKVFDHFNEFFNYFFNFDTKQFVFSQLAKPNFKQNESAGILDFNSSSQNRLPEEQRPFMPNSTTRLTYSPPIHLRFGAVWCMHKSSP